MIFYPFIIYLFILSLLPLAVSVPVTDKKMVIQLNNSTEEAVRTTDKSKLIPLNYFLVIDLKL